MRIYIKPDFQKIIKEEREKRNWSIADLAKQARITWPALMKIEKGKATPLKSTLDKIGEALGIPPLYVIDFGDKTDKEMQTQPSNQNQIKEKESER